jgi:hypothetical protein
MWSAAIGACIAVAEHNHSSALHLARHLKVILIGLPERTQLIYLKALQRIIEEAGISLLRYGTTQLPGIFQETGEAHASRFLAQGLAIARRYGKVAAEEFFEQRSSASREALPLEPIVSGAQGDIERHGNRNPDVARSDLGGGFQ